MSLTNTEPQRLGFGGDSPPPFATERVSSCDIYLATSHHAAISSPTPPLPVASCGSKPDQLIGFMHPQGYESRRQDRREKREAGEEAANIPPRALPDAHLPAFQP
jgi:hypothetical protein